MIHCDDAMLLRRSRLQTWAAHSARTARTASALPPMLEDSPVEVGMPASLPMCRSTSMTESILSASGGDYLASSCGPDRLSRSGSTSVMSVSEFYGPSGARMLQRRGSAAIQMSLTESYGENELLERRASRDENREGQAALSSMLVDSATAEEEQQEKKAQDACSGSVGSSVVSDVKRAAPSILHASMTTATSHNSAVSEAVVTNTHKSFTLNSGSAVLYPGQQQQAGSVVAVAQTTSTVDGAGPSDKVILLSSSASPPVPPAAGTATLAPGGLTTGNGNLLTASGTTTPGAARTGVSFAVDTTDGTASETVVSQKSPSAATPDTLLPPPLTLEAPYLSSANDGIAVPQASGGQRQQLLQRQPLAGGAGPASSFSVPWVTISSVSPVESRMTDGSIQQEQHNSRVGLTRAMSVDSASSPSIATRTLPHSLSGSGLTAGTLSGSEACGLTVGVGNGGSVARSTGGAVHHSPRLRAKSMDSGGRKDKNKRGKGPNAAVMGKADRIGRMLQVIFFVCKDGMKNKLKEAAWAVNSSHVIFFGNWHKFERR